MKFLDSNGVAILWSKIKQYVGERTGSVSLDWNSITNKPDGIDNGPFLPLAGGTMTGQLVMNYTGSMRFIHDPESSSGMYLDDSGITICYGANSTDPSRNNTGITIRETGIYNNDNKEDLGVWTTDGGHYGLKTVNGQSLLGDGNITIEGGSSVDNITIDNLDNTLINKLVGIDELEIGSSAGSTSLKPTGSGGYISLSKGSPQKPGFYGVFIKNYVPFKSINGQSIIGTGDIQIEGGSGGDGNNYPTAVGLNPSNNGSLYIAIDRAGLASIQDHVFIHTINGASPFGEGDMKGGTVSASGSSPGLMSVGDKQKLDAIQPGATAVSISNVSGTGTRIATININGTSTDIKAPAAGTRGITQTEADDRYIKRTGDSGMSGNYTFSSASSITAGSFYESSDINLKENISSITKEATYAVDCLAFKQFNFKDDKDKTTKYGVIAQEVEVVGLGNLVKENKEGEKSVDYISLLILKIEALEKRVAELEAERG